MDSHNCNQKIPTLITKGATKTVNVPQNVPQKNDQCSTTSSYNALGQAESVCGTVKNAAMSNLLPLSYSTSVASSFSPSSTYFQTATTSLQNLNASCTSQNSPLDNQTVQCQPSTTSFLPPSVSLSFLSTCHPPPNISCLTAHSAYPVTTTSCSSSDAHGKYSHPLTPSVTYPPPASSILPLCAHTLPSNIKFIAINTSLPPPDTHLLHTSLAVPTSVICQPPPNVSLPPPLDVSLPPPLDVSLPPPLDVSLPPPLDVSFPSHSNVSIPPPAITDASLSSHISLPPHVMYCPPPDISLPSPCMSHPPPDICNPLPNTSHPPPDRSLPDSHHLIPDVSLPSHILPLNTSLPPPGLLPHVKSHSLPASSLPLPNMYVPPPETIFSPADMFVKPPKSSLPYAQNAQKSSTFTAYPYHSSNIHSSVLPPSFQSAASLTTFTSDSSFVSDKQSKITCDALRIDSVSPISSNSTEDSLPCNKNESLATVVEYASPISSDSDSECFSAQNKYVLANKKHVHSRKRSYNSEDKSPEHLLQKRRITETDTTLERGHKKSDDSWKRFAVRNLSQQDQRHRLHCGSDAERCLSSGRDSPTSRHALINIQHSDGTGRFSHSPFRRKGSNSQVLERLPLSHERTEKLNIRASSHHKNVHENLDVEHLKKHEGQCQNKFFRKHSLPVHRDDETGSSSISQHDPVKGGHMALALQTERHELQSPEPTYSDSQVHYKHPAEHGDREEYLKLVRDSKNEHPRLRSAASFSHESRAPSVEHNTMHRHHRKCTDNEESYKHNGFSAQNDGMHAINRVSNDCDIKHGHVHQSGLDCDKFHVRHRSSVHHSKLRVCNKSSIYSNDLHERIRHPLGQAGLHERSPLLDSDSLYEHHARPTSRHDLYEQRRPSLGHGHLNDHRHPAWQDELHEPQRSSLEHENVRDRHRRPSDRNDLLEWHRSMDHGNINDHKQSEDNNFSYEQGRPSQDQSNKIDRYRRLATGAREHHSRPLDGRNAHENHRRSADHSDFCEEVEHSLSHNISERQRHLPDRIDLYDQCRPRPSQSGVNVKEHHRRRGDCENIHKQQSALNCGNTLEHDKLSLESGNLQQYHERPDDCDDSVLRIAHELQVDTKILGSSRPEFNESSSHIIHGSKIEQSRFSKTRMNKKMNEQKSTQSEIKERSVSSVENHLSQGHSDDSHKRLDQQKTHLVEKESKSLYKNQLNIFDESVSEGTFHGTANALSCKGYPVTNSTLKAPQSCSTDTEYLNKEQLILQKGISRKPNVNDDDGKKSSIAKSTAAVTSQSDCDIDQSSFNGSAKIQKVGESLTSQSFHESPKTLDSNASSSHYKIKPNNNSQSGASGPLLNVSINSSCESEECSSPALQVTEIESSDTTKNDPANDGDTFAAEETVSWIRSSPADLFYYRNFSDGGCTEATSRTKQVCEQFYQTLVMRGIKAREFFQNQNQEQEAQNATKAKEKGDAYSNQKRSSVLDSGKNVTDTVEKTITKSKSKASDLDKHRSECSSGSGSDISSDSDSEDDHYKCSSNTKKKKHINKNSSKQHRQNKNCSKMNNQGHHSHDHHHKHHHSKSKNKNNDSDTSDSNSDSDSFRKSQSDRSCAELEKKKNHPQRLHPELWHNESGEMNDGPLCLCKARARRSGIRHGYYVGENSISSCLPWSNNANKLYHYRMTISPPTNFLLKNPSIIEHDGHEFIFEGFSLLSHELLESVPACRVLRFNIHYTVGYEQEELLDNYCIRELDLFFEYLFHELLDLVDLNFRPNADTNSCPSFHLMPRYVRGLPDNGKEVLAMCEVLQYLLRSCHPVVPDISFDDIVAMPQQTWLDNVDTLKGMLVTRPGMKPSTLRVDQLDRDPLLRARGVTGDKQPNTSDKTAENDEEGGRSNSRNSGGIANEDGCRSDSRNSGSRMADRSDDRNDGRMADTSDRRNDSRSSSRVPDRSDSGMTDWSDSRNNGRSGSRMADRSARRSDGRNDSRTADRSDNRNYGRSDSGIADRSANMNDGRSYSRMADRIDTRYDGRSDSRMADRIDTRYDGRSDSRMADRTDTRNDGRSDSRMAGRSANRSDGRNNSRMADRTDTRNSGRMAVRSESKRDGMHSRNASNERIGNRSAFSRDNSNDFGDSLSRNSRDRRRYADARSPRGEKRPLSRDFDQRQEKRTGQHSCRGSSLSAGRDRGNRDVERSSSLNRASKFSCNRDITTKDNEYKMKSQNVVRESSSSSQNHEVTDKARGRQNGRRAAVSGDPPSAASSEAGNLASTGAGEGYPVIVHFGIRPSQLSYAGNAEYQKNWREYVKLRHLVANMTKPTVAIKRRLQQQDAKLRALRTSNDNKRDVTAAVSAMGFLRTGIMCDVVQHALLIPVLACHLRFHKSLSVLQRDIGYTFHNKYLLQLALTHPSFRENFGTNPDHVRNTLTNCGIRQPEYGDRRVLYMNTRKRGINTLINIMARFGHHNETDSQITHYERLEFLGDAVVEFLTSIHLFHLFPQLEEGGLATYRAALVQNQHLAVLAERLRLDQFLLYAHGSDLCHDFELRLAMANCFEALMAAIFLDSNIGEVDNVLTRTLFKDDLVLQKVWRDYPPHPLQEQEPHGDRKWIDSYPLLQKLTQFEDSIGVRFRHIRILARAFTDRSSGPNHLTLGSNQRLEFLGDTVLQLVASEFLYKHFPDHHEGHLSLLRSSLVNNRTQAVVCDDLNMTAYSHQHKAGVRFKIKHRADLLEAFLGALYIDRGLLSCRRFCDVCFFPRLHQFILNQDWNDPKSKLQQCCLTLRTMDGSEPDIPEYKVIMSKGPTNTRVYTVAVYFRNERLAVGSGQCIQRAEMAAAEAALLKSKDLFPQLEHQKRILERSFQVQRQNLPLDTSCYEQSLPFSYPAKMDIVYSASKTVSTASQLPGSSSQEYGETPPFVKQELDEQECIQSGNVVPVVGTISGRSTVKNKVALHENLSALTGLEKLNRCVDLMSDGGNISAVSACVIDVNKERATSAVTIAKAGQALQTGNSSTTVTKTSTSTSITGANVSGTAASISHKNIIATGPRRTNVKAKVMAMIRAAKENEDIKAKSNKLAAATAGTLGNFIADSYSSSVTSVTSQATAPVPADSSTGSDVPSAAAVTLQSAATATPVPDTGTGSDVPSAAAVTLQSAATVTPVPDTGTGSDVPSATAVTLQSAATVTPVPDTGTGSDIPSATAVTLQSAATVTPVPDTGTGSDVPSAAAVTLQSAATVTPVPDTGTDSDVPSAAAVTLQSAATATPVPNTGTGSDVPSAAAVTLQSAATATPVPDTGTGSDIPSATAVTLQSAATATPVPDTGTGSDIPSAAAVTLQSASAVTPVPDSGTGSDVPSAAAVTLQSAATVTPIPDTGTDSDVPSAAAVTLQSAATATPVPDTGTGSDVPSAAAVTLQSAAAVTPVPDNTGIVPGTPADVAAILQAVVAAAVYDDAGTDSHVSFAKAVSSQSTAAVASSTGDNCAASGAPVAATEAVHDASLVGTVGNTRTASSEDLIQSPVPAAVTTVRDNTGTVPTAAVDVSATLQSVTAFTSQSAAVASSTADNYAASRAPVAATEAALDASLVSTVGHTPAAALCGVSANAVDNQVHVTGTPEGASSEPERENGSCTSMAPTVKGKSVVKEDVETFIAGDKADSDANKFTELKESAIEGTNDN